MTGYEQYGAKTLSLTTLGIMKHKTMKLSIAILSIMALSITIKNAKLSPTTISIIKLSTMMLRLMTLSIRTLSITLKM
jgi:hypothetical protein